MRPRTRGPLDIISLLAAAIQPGASTPVGAHGRIEVGPVAEGPPERPALHGQLQAGRVEVGAAPGQPRTGAVDDQLPDPDEPHQLVLVGPASAADAGALGDHP